VFAFKSGALGYREPWVIRVDVTRLGLSLSGSLGFTAAWSDPGTPHAHLIAVQFNSTQILPYVAVNKDALPNSPAEIAGCIKSFRLPKQAQVFHVIFQAQYQAFVRFAVGRGAAL
jgi:hypothetical protein